MVLCLMASLRLRMVGPSVPIQKFLSSLSVDVEGAAAEALDGRQDIVG